MNSKLSELKYGQEGIVKDVVGDLKFKIAGMGIRIGKRVKMLSKQPLKGPIVVLVDENNTSLGRGIADKIIVEAIK